MIDNALNRVITVKGSVVESRKQMSGYVSIMLNKYNQEKNEVILKAKEYRSSLTGQVSETVKQAPEVVKNLSNKAASLTKQGLEISIGHEKTESVLNSVKTHTPRFVTSFLSTESPAAETTTQSSDEMVNAMNPVAAH
jgi:DNA-binding protein